MRYFAEAPPANHFSRNHIFNGMTASVERSHLHRSVDDSRETINMPDARRLNFRQVNLDAERVHSDDSPEPEDVWLDQSGNVKRWLRLADQLLNSDADASSEMAVG